MGKLRWGGRGYREKLLSPQVLFPNALTLHFVLNQLPGFSVWYFPSSESSYSQKERLYLSSDVIRKTVSSVKPKTSYHNAQKCISFHPGWDEKLDKY